MRNFTEKIAGTLPLGYYVTGGRKYRRYMGRNGHTIKKVVLHHVAGGDAAIKGALLNTSRTLSIQYTILENCRWYGVVSERFKANTTAHPVDFEAITVEITDDGGEEGAGNPDSWYMTPEKLESVAAWVADMLTYHDLPINRQTVTVHRDYRATRCPGEYLYARLDWIIDRARAIAGQDAPAPAPKPAPSKPAPAPSKASRRTDMLGDVRVGSTLRLINWMVYNDADLGPDNKIGTRTGTFKVTGIAYEPRGGEPSLHLDGKYWVSYLAKRGLVSGKPKPQPARKSNATLADEVLAGKWGNGAERKRRLESAGYDYAAVQRAVNARLSGGSKPGKSISDMASEVIRGEHGNGHAARQRSLGVSDATYAKVRAEVNRRV